MVIVSQLSDGTLALKSNYYYKDRLRAIPTAMYNPSLKQWVIQQYMLGKLEESFKGELVYKTPRWVILKEPMPDLTKMYEITDKSLQVPQLKLKPYDYQSYGIKYMIDKLLKHNFVFNCDGVGLGKTIQTIGVLKWFIDNKSVDHILIICKKSIKKQWHDEFDKFTDLSNSFDIIYTEDTASKRHKAYEKYAHSQQGILITNYHSFLNDTAYFKNLPIDFVVIDEAHSVATRKGKINNNIKSVVDGRTCIFLTGTPVMSKPEDIFSITQIADSSYFGPWKDFSKEYLVYANSPFGYQLVGCKNLDKLRHKIQDILIRRTEYEVSVQLPNTVTTRIDCDMDSVQVRLLSVIEEEQNDIISKMKALKKSDGSVSNSQQYAMLDAMSKSLISAKQAACTDPRMFSMSLSKKMKERYAQYIPSNYKSSAKLENLCELVETIVDGGNKVIIFSKFRTSAVLAAKDISSKLKYNVLLYTGAEDGETRNRNLDLFRNDDTYNVIIGTDAMAEGVNLAEAKYVINIDQPDTSAIKTQRIGRARRVSSQFDTVICYDLITNSSNGVKSKDEERLENIEKTKNIDDALIGASVAQRAALINAIKKESD